MLCVLLFIITFAVTLYYQSIDIYLESLNHLTNIEKTSFQFLNCFMKMIGLYIVFMVLIKRVEIITLTVVILFASIIGFEAWANFSYYHYSWIFAAILVSGLIVSYKLIWFLIMQNSPLCLTGLTQGMIKAIWIGAFTLSHITYILLAHSNPIYLLGLSFISIVFTLILFITFWYTHCP